MNLRSLESIELGMRWNSFYKNNGLFPSIPFSRHYKWNSTSEAVGDNNDTFGADNSRTKDKTFKVGDSLVVFNYPTSHTIGTLSSCDYNTCTVGNLITTDNTGNTTVALKTLN
ncbi:hypothetical protein V6N13_059357 [Hibiscus sabdariffa]